jgi:hypothetical protein
MARLISVNTDGLVTASNLDLSAFSKITVALWLWWDTYGTDDSTALAGPTGLPNGYFDLTPNHPSGSIQAIALHSAGTNGFRFTRPSAGAWHHYVLVLDYAIVGSPTVTEWAVWVDGVSITPSGVGAADLTGNLSASHDLTFFKSVSGTGRIAEVALWPGLAFSGTDVSSLYNGGAGKDARQVQTASLTDYWPIEGLASPEPNLLTGRPALTLTGTSFVAHPISVSTAHSAATGTTIYRSRMRTY